MSGVAAHGRRGHATEDPGSTGALRGGAEAWAECANRVDEQQSPGPAVLRIPPETVPTPPAAPEQDSCRAVLEGLIHDYAVAAWAGSPTGGRPATPLRGRGPFVPARAPTDRG